VKAQPHPHAKNPTISRKNVRALDRAAIDEFSIPSIVLMENAATSIFEVADRLLRDRPGDTIILCGTGNNGGDGFALVRKLTNAGIACECVLVGNIEHAHGDARTNLTIAQKMGIPILGEPTISAPALVIDAIFGTGLARPIEGAASSAVDAINAFHAAGTTVLAVDVSSGLDCDTGEPLGTCCVRADTTITLAAYKIGFANPASNAYTGDVFVGDIGVPRELIERFAK